MRRRRSAPRGGITIMMATWTSSSGTSGGDNLQKSCLYRNEGQGIFTKITEGSVVANSAIHVPWRVG